MAAYLDMRPDTIRSALVGRRPIPVGAINELVVLWYHIEALADKIVDRVDAYMLDGEVLEIGLPPPEQIEALGLPTTSTLERAFALVIARVPYEAKIIGHELVEGSIYLSLK